MSDYYATRMVDAAVLVSELEMRMTFVDGSRQTHELLSARCSMSRSLSSFLQGRVYFGPPAPTHAGVTVAATGERGILYEWVVCAVDGVT